jgi:anti-sigma regulatory factor (Ser/Thr protein kinase)
VRIENTRVARPVALQHRCAFYTSPADLTRQLHPAVRSAIAAGTTVAIAAPRSTVEELFAEFGRIPQLVELDRPGRSAHSGQTVATERALELRELTVARGPIMMVNQHDSAYDGSDGSFWTELDAAFNVALAALPVELTCYYPDLPLHREITEGARSNHPSLLSSGFAHHNPAHQNPRTVLATHPAPVPALLGVPVLEKVFGAWQLNEVRAAIEEELLEAGYGLDRAEDVVLAVNEVATNAVEHGANEAHISLWLEPDGAVCEVVDRGTLADPLPGLVAPHSSVPRGRGIWIARQICDALHVWADDQGTHVRIHAGRPV